MMTLLLDLPFPTSLPGSSRLYAPGQTIVSFAMKSLTQQTFMTVLSRVFFLNRLTELEEVALAKKDGNEKKDLPKLASMSGQVG